MLEREGNRERGRGGRRGRKVKGSLGMVSPDQKMRQKKKKDKVDSRYKKDTLVETLFFCKGCCKCLVLL